MFTYIYYTFYKFILITPSKNELPEHLANSSISLLYSINAITLMYFLKIKSVFIGYLFFLNPKIYFALLFIIFFILNYILFIKGKKYLKIKIKYDTEPKNLKILKMSFVVFYIIISIILLFTWGGKE